MFSKTFVRTVTSGPTREIIKFYYDFKSPYTYLALEPVLDLEKNYPVSIRFMPWAFRPEETFGGKLEERTRLHWNKVRYIYLDCRRFANERGMIIRGPERLFDSRLSLLAGLYADQQKFFPNFAQRIFERFFQRQLNLEDLEQITAVLHETSNSPLSLADFAKQWQAYLHGQAPEDFQAVQEEAEKDQIFGVPTLMVRGEPFWGHDRLSWVKKRLESSVQT